MRPDSSTSVRNRSPDGRPSDWRQIRRRSITFERMQSKRRRLPPEAGERERRTAPGPTTTNPRGRSGVQHGPGVVVGAGMFRGRILGETTSRRASWVQSPKRCRSSERRTAAASVGGASNHARASPYRTHHHPSMTTSSHAAIPEGGDPTPGAGAESRPPTGRTYAGAGGGRESCSSVGIRCWPSPRSVRPHRG